MDRVFSVDEIPDHLWSPQIHISAGADDSSNSKMSRSASEWAFQRFIQETSATSPLSSSSVADDVVFVDIDPRSKQNNIEASPLPTDAAVLTNGPPPVAVDSDEYRAFLKSKLNLACAAVAMTRVFLLFPFELIQCERKKKNHSILFDYISIWIGFLHVLSFGVFSKIHFFLILGSDSSELSIVFLFLFFLFS